MLLINALAVIAAIQGITAQHNFPKIYHGNFGHDLSFHSFASVFTRLWKYRKGYYTRRRSSSCDMA
jgi:hypothetical protein